MSDDPCIFPFIYDGQTFSECTESGWDTPWCATEVTTSLTYSNWDGCAPGCPGVHGIKRTKSMNTFYHLYYLLSFFST